MVRKEKGFTIIEVVLVLAIAGLIFLVVFLALPALQRNQRDTARKNDVGIVASAINSYSSNNKGALPTTEANVTDYAGNMSNNIANVSVTTTTSATAGSGAEVDKIVVVTGAQCGDNGATTSGTARQSAVIVKLEAGSNVFYCQDV